MRTVNYKYCRGNNNILQIICSNHLRKCMYYENSFQTYMLKCFSRSYDPFHYEFWAFNKQKPDLDGFYCIERNSTKRISIVKLLQYSTTMNDNGELLRIVDIMTLPKGKKRKEPSLLLSNYAKKQQHKVAIKGSCDRFMNILLNEVEQ